MDQFKLLIHVSAGANGVSPAASWVNVTDAHMQRVVWMGQHTGTVRAEGPAGPQTCPGGAGQTAAPQRHALVGFLFSAS